MKYWIKVFIFYIVALSFVVLATSLSEYIRNYLFY